jgi:ribonuclease HI
MTKEKPKPFVEIFADGACSGNPGVGGFGAILRTEKKEKEMWGSEIMATNNRMELMGVITALEALKVPCRVRVTTDSNYIVKGMTEWIRDWIRKGWKNSQKKDVMNRDLWERLLKAAEPHDVTWCWIKGHNGHAENERCDELARMAIGSCRKTMSEEEVGA